MKQYVQSKWAKVSGLALFAAVAMMAFASTASAAVDVDKLTEPIEDEVAANTPKLLLFIGTILAIGFVIGWGISLLRKGKRT
jgi:uncharacterized membrane protein